jgi:2TM domain
MTQEGREQSSERPGSERPGSERELALQQIKKRRDLHAHLVTYVVVNAALWTIWAVTGAGYPWPAWVSGAWAIGLVMNVWDVYIRRPITDAEVEREIKRLHAQH